MAEHPWKLVSPWYRINSVGGVRSNRGAAPILQKYAATDFANRIAVEPQQSLKYTGEDFVNRITVDPDQVVTPAMRAANNEPIKLFLDLHSRFYAIVAELHCDLPGFPNVRRDEVCEAGFVIRRRVPIVPAAARAEVARNRFERGRLKKKLLKTMSGVGGKTAATETLGDMIREKNRTFSDKFRQRRAEQLRASLEENALQFGELKSKHKITTRLEGWLPGGENGIGDWQSIDEEPEQLTEAVFPMYPLIADPTELAHSSAGRTQWFGVVPTSSSDIDSTGRPRFSDNVLYEIRCYVRRHKPHCPKKTNQTDCSGAIVWSAATEGHQIASAYDLDGASHRPFNIARPDLRALSDQAALGPPGRGVNTRVSTPEGGNFNFGSAGMDMPSSGSSGSGDEFCFYFYLIFFIVAFFLFQLFLPILMFILQLWFLLTLRLCIPPSIGFDADIAADLKLEGELGVKLDAGIGVNFGAGVHFTRDSLKNAIADELASGIAVEGGFATDFANGLKNDSSMSVDDIGDLFINTATDFSDNPERDELGADPPTPERGLVYFEKVAAA